MNEQETFEKLVSSFRKTVLEDDHEKAELKREIHKVRQDNNHIKQQNQHLLWRLNRRVTPDDINKNEIYLVNKIDILEEEVRRLEKYVQVLR